MAKAKARLPIHKANTEGIIVIVDVKDYNESSVFIPEALDEYAQSLRGFVVNGSEKYVDPDFHAVYRFYNWDDAKEFRDTVDKNLLYGLGV